MTVTAVLCIATAIYMEARGEPLPGQFAVAEVIVRRMRDPRRWPDTACGVVYQPRQFAWTSTPVRPDHRTPAWDLAVSVAQVVWVGSDGRGAATRCAEFFASGPPPWWARHMVPDVRIGGHSFYCLPQSAAAN